MSKNVKGGGVYRFGRGRCNTFRNFDFDRNSIKQEKLLIASYYYALLMSYFYGTNSNRDSLHTGIYAPADVMVQPRLDSPKMEYELHIRFHKINNFRSL